MRMSLTIDGVQARGVVALRNPTLWPVWFAMDGEGLSFLLGDPAATANIDAPGPRPATEPLRWERTVHSHLLPDDTLGIGVALLYTEGGSGSQATQSRYERLTADVHHLVTRHVAASCALQPLLTAVGLDSDAAPLPLELLRKGTDAEALERAIPPVEIESGDGVRLTAALLGTFAERPLPATDVISGRAELRAAPSLARGMVERLPEEVRRLSGFPVRADDTTPQTPVRVPVRLPLPLPIPPRSTGVADGTVVASLVQLWPAATLPIGVPVPFRRTLDARGLARASFQLAGTVMRGE